jgi:hypothetical protein
MTSDLEKDLARLEILREELTKEGYINLRVIEGRGICGLREFIFTIGLCEGLTNIGYSGRYCYSKEQNGLFNAILGLKLWDGKDDPTGPWIKYKGKRGEYSKGQKQER